MLHKIFTNIYFLTFFPIFLARYTIVFLFNYFSKHYRNVINLMKIPRQKLENNDKKNQKNLLLVNCVVGSVLNVIATFIV